MKILALDTATAACSVAVMCGDEIRARRFTVMDRGHAEALMPMVADAMAEVRLDYADLDLLATTVGPGSFTGLRVGLAAARGLALAIRLPIVGVTTLEALAHGLPLEKRGGRRVVAAIDARRGEVYVQGFATDLTPLGPPQALAPTAAAGSLPAGPLVLVGNGAGMVQAALAGRDHDIVVVDEPQLPDAVHVAAVAAIRFAEADHRAGPVPRPLYLRPSGARLPTGRCAS